MEISVIHPTLEEYSNRVNALATKYGKDTWLGLTLDPCIMDEDDRDEFAFIHCAVGDQLISREFQSLNEAFSSIIDETEEPGLFPGSSVSVGVKFERSRVYRIN
jgi:hypothetical protein